MTTTTALIYLLGYGSAILSAGCAYYLMYTLLTNLLNTIKNDEGYHHDR